MAPSRIPTVVDGQLLPAPGSEPRHAIPVGSPPWYEWLDDAANRSFSYHTAHGAVTIRREQKRHSWYWYAYHTVRGTLHKVYLGKSADLAPDRLADAARRLTEPHMARPEPAIRLFLLGSPRLECDGRAVHLANAKALALLAYLAGHERPVSRQHLLALLWPDSSGQAASKNLRNTLWYLRRALGHDAVEGTDYLALGSGVWVDERTVDRQARRPSPSGDVGGDEIAVLEQTLALFLGDFMEGVSISGAPDLDIWLANTRAHVHEAHLRALHALASAYRRHERWNDVIAVTHAALSLDALQEPIYRLLMEAHAMQGDRAAALRHYDALRETLDAHLGVAPLPETDALRDAILRGALQPPRPAAPSRTLPSSPSMGAASPFVGRADELRVLDTAWQTTRTGTAQAALLSGEAGIGKTRLWRVWTATLDPQATALEARCLATTQHLPFAPLVDMLRRAPSRERLCSLTASTPTPGWLPDLVRLMPELRDGRPQLPAPLRLPTAEEQRHIFEALVQSLAVASHHPVVLFIDDLHWADQATLDWLGYAVHRAERLPLLVVGTYRSDEASPALLRLQTAWGRDGILHALPLARLSRSEAKSLVAALDGSPDHADRLYAQSAGNPLFLRELLRAEPGVVPSTLTDLIERRLDRLSATARQVLHAAAALGEEIAFGLLQQTSGRTDEETLDAIDELLAAELLVEHHHSFVFSHPLIAFVVDATLSGPRRSVLHRRAAAALERSYADRSVIAGRLARHYREAQDAPRAAQYAEWAGDAALLVSAPLEAAHFYSQALDLEWTPARAFGLGRATYRSGDLVAARPVLVEAMNGYERAGDHGNAARSALEMALTFFADGHLDEVVRWAQRGRDYLHDAHDPRALALAAYLLGAEMRIAQRSPADAIAYLQESMRLTTEIDEPGLLPSILLELGNARAQQGDIDGAVEAYRDLVARAQQTGNDLHETLGYNNLAYHLLLQREIAAARSVVETGLLIAHERDVQPALIWLHSTSGEIALAEQRWDAARGAFGRAIDLAAHFGNAEHVLNCRVNLAVAAHGHGATGAYAMLRAVERDATAVPDAYLHMQIRYWIAVTAPPQQRHETPADVLAHAAHALRPGEYERMRRWLTCLHGLAPLPDAAAAPTA